MRGTFSGKMENDIDDTSKKQSPKADKTSGKSLIVRSRRYYDVSYASLPLEKISNVKILHFGRSRTMYEKV